MSFKRVVKTFSDGKVVNSEEQILVRDYGTDNMANITATYGALVPLKEPKFSNVRVECSVTIPCYLEEMQEAFKFAWEQAHAEISAQLKASVLRQDVKGAIDND